METTRNNPKRIFAFILIILGTCIFQSCKNENTQDAEAAKSLPALSQGRLGTLMAQVERTEVTFYGNNPFTMNVDQNGALSFMRNIKEEQVTDLDCAKAQGRMFLYGNGESLADVEFCISAECYYYIFYVNGEKYANPFPKENATLIESMLNSKMENR